MGIRISRVAVMMAFSFVTAAYASKPLLSMVAVIKAPNTLAKNRAVNAVFQVMNNTPGFYQAVMLSIAGVAQITTTTGACSNPLSLSAGQSCLLNLRITGSQISNRVVGGPVLCKLSGNSPNPYSCSQPSLQDQFDIQQTADELVVGNTWISVLIAESQPPDDIQTYVKQLKNLAPAAKQIHLRVVPGETNYQKYADLIALLRTAYGESLLVGYHPDNSKTSYTGWGCTDGDWSCVLSQSIINMNNMNQVADPKQTGQGFNIFSLEQGYVDLVVPTFQDIKACLNPAESAPLAVCPVLPTVASPVVQFGDVLQSYGGSDIYGSDALDYGYPQYYNLGKSLSSQYSGLVSSDNNSFFPPYSAADCIDSQPYPYNVVDVNSSGNVPAPKIPCFSNTPNVYNYSNPPDPILPGAYVSYLMTQLEPISDQVNTHGATVYITFSGEDIFLGAPGWTLELINQFNQQLNIDFTRLKKQYPSLFTNSVDTSTIQYAIWNFDSILANNP